MRQALNPASCSPFDDLTFEKFEKIEKRASFQNGTIPVFQRLTTPFFLTKTTVRETNAFEKSNLVGLFRFGISVPACRQKKAGNTPPRNISCLFFVRYVTFTESLSLLRGTSSSPQFSVLRQTFPDHRFPAASADPPPSGLPESARWAA